MSKDDLPEDDVKNKFTCNVCKVSRCVPSVRTSINSTKNTCPLVYIIASFFFYSQRCGNKELTPSIKKSQLNRLLKYTATKMKERVSKIVLHSCTAYALT